MNKYDNLICSFWTMATAIKRLLCSLNLQPAANVNRRSIRICSPACSLILPLVLPCVRSIVASLRHDERIELRQECNRPHEIACECRKDQCGPPDSLVLSLRTCDPANGGEGQDKYQADDNGPSVRHVGELVPAQYAMSFCVEIV